MKLSLADAAKQFNVTPDVIADYIAEGLVPSKTALAEGMTLDDRDRYWVEMVHCFIENGSSIQEIKQLMKHCQL
ncbi:MerR family transcriptional regulator [Lentilactobacillus raoultii]|uniref:MerR family transcriptional regulator n=1 Tax=Lentilactobacillus raoultii TaxID=1987503 RepID=A0ABW3PGG7_9LACO|nr:MerR family transcriptional regulator [Lentilactobacillus raoultii]